MREAAKLYRYRQMREWPRSSQAQDSWGQSWDGHSNCDHSTQCQQVKSSVFLGNGERTICTYVCARGVLRAILKEAARFPSTKRAAIIEDIKFEFHKNKVLTSAAEIKNQMRLANESLEQLKNYNNLSGPESSLYLKGPCQQG